VLIIHLRQKIIYHNTRIWQVSSWIKMAKFWLLNILILYKTYRKMARKDIAVAAIAWIMMMKIAPKLLLDGDGEDDTRN